MGLTKQYLRYAPSSVFNVVGSQKSNAIYLSIQGVQGKYCAVGACENVIVWDLRTGSKHVVLQGGKHEVTALAKSPDHRHVAVGYHDGTVMVFNLHTGDATVTFSGHKSCVTALQYDHIGVRLVSGSKDTDIIVWDIINESGLYRLKGHKGQVTQARFMREKNILVTSSKDTFIKFWDLDTQHCFKTLVGQRTEVWDFVLCHNDTRLVTGSGDNEIRVWSITDGQDTQEQDPAAKMIKLEEGVGQEEEEESDILSCKKIGSIIRRGKERVVTMTTDPKGTILGVHGNDTLLELFKLDSEVEIDKRIQKRQKKARKRQRDSDTTEDVTVGRTVDDDLRRICETRVKGKIRAFDILLEGNNAKIVVLLTCNMLEQFTLDVGEKKPECQSIGKLTMPGHKTDVRTVAFSSDNTAFLSASAESVKIWNRASQFCIRTMNCGYALSSLFAPGDRHVVIGTKSGKLQILDIASGTMLEEIDAHEGAVWSICMSPDKRGIVSGSADHEVMFWDFELVDDGEQFSTRKRLTLVHSRTLKMSEDVLCVQFSPDQRLLAVSLLDNTVKVFFSDTLKFFLSLYGHKLPVLCMDISSDSQLLVTGSADRNVKLWGLDFGDCHKSIFAHDDCIMSVKFVPKTHLFFTCGKDKKVKQWDGDKFEHILTLEGHHAEVWTMGISPSGNFILSSSHDRSLRIWERTSEPLILEEEKEMQREKEHDEAIEGEQPVVPGEVSTEVAIAGKKTVETVKAAERIMEALELYKEEVAKLQQHDTECKAKGKELPPLPLHPMFMAFSVTTPKEYVMKVLRRVRSSELEESLLVLPFNYVVDLLELLDAFLASHWETELCCRCLFFLLRVHHGQITSNQMLMPVLDRLQSQTTDRVNEIRDRIGFNMAGLQFLKKQIESKDEVMLFADATGNYKAKKKKHKKKALLTIRT